MRVVICGGGAIGACIAYFLQRRGADVVLVERTEVAAAASGKAGGFLAFDWCAGSPLDALARRSFALHAALPDEIGGNWGYGRLASYSGLVAADDDRRRHATSRLGWLNAGIVITQQLSTPQTTAIVNPRSFTTAMMAAAQAHGAELRSGQVTGLHRSADGSAVRGVEVDGDIIEAEAVVVAMGPWSVLAAGWMRLPAVFGMRSPSLVYETGSDVPAEALFLEGRDANGDALSIEVFPRADGTTHVVAFSSQTALPFDPAAVRPQPSEISRLQAICERLSPAFRAERIIARQACFRPVTEDGLPLIGQVSDGVYVATGHSVWGILNAPATGEAIAGLITGGDARSVDLAPFDPGRLQPLDPSMVRTR